MRLWHRFIHPISAYFRRKRTDVILRHYPEIGEWSICDLGGSRHFWQEANLKVDPARVTILNISLDETDAYDHPELQAIPVLLYDGRNIPAKDKSFDLLVCNSVLEHVPPSDRAALCDEMRRVAKRIYLQTPAHEFPIEPHFILPFLHWFPRRVARGMARLGPWFILARPSKAAFAEYFDGTHLLTRTEVVRLFPDANVRSERLAGFLKSHLVFWEAPL
jgi:hypothetical protein